MAGLWRCFNHNRHVSTTWFPPIALAYPLQPPGQASERLLFLGSLWSPQITLNPPSPATSILQPEGLHKHHQAWKTVRRLTPFFFCVKAFFFADNTPSLRDMAPLIRTVDCVWKHTSKQNNQSMWHLSAMNSEASSVVFILLLLIWWLLYGYITKLTQL